MKAMKHNNFIHTKNQSAVKTAFLLSALFIIATITSCNKQAVQPASTKTTTTTANQEKMVATPFGMVAASKVHLVEQGTEVAAVNGHITKINSSTGAVIEDYGKISTSNITESATNLSSRFSAHNLATTTGGVGNGYYVYGNLPSGKNIQSFSTSWVVPSAPSRDSTLFLWNGADNVDGTSFMQPVLGWNDGHGATWFIQNWGFANGNYFHSNAITVSSGTTVTGVMTQISAKNGTYKYSIAFAGHSSITYTQSYPEPANQVIECWEAYTNTYLAFPPDQKAAMKSMNLQYVGSGTTNQSITWVQTSDGAIYTPSGQNTVLVNNGTNNSEVDFYFQ